MMAPNKKIIEAGTIGNVKQYPVIASLVEKLNDNPKFSKRCLSLLESYNRSLHISSAIADKDDRMYVINLIKKDYLERLAISHMKGGLPGDIKSIHRHYHNAFIRR